MLLCCYNVSPAAPLFLNSAAHYYCETPRNTFNNNFPVTNQVSPPNLHCSDVNSFTDLQCVLSFPVKTINTSYFCTNHPPLVIFLKVGICERIFLYETKLNAQLETNQPTIPSNLFIQY
jgi:hypothetical protein